MLATWRSGSGLAVVGSWRRGSGGSGIFQGRGGAGGVFLERSGTHSAHCAEDRGDSGGAVLGGSTVEVPQTQFTDRVRLSWCEVPQVQFLDELFFDCAFPHIDKVVDVPVVTHSCSARVGVLRFLREVALGP